MTIKRLDTNPILAPNPKNSWEQLGAFNGCAVKVGATYHMVYRALSSPESQHGLVMNISTIGYTTSKDGIHFGEHLQLIQPDTEWDKYGCEDPRITFIDGTFYIFYTALASYPFTPSGIKIGLAKTKDFKKIEKYPVTTFNSKAMALFPQKIRGKFAALLTVHTDIPPAKIAVAFFDKEEELWSPSYWKNWYQTINEHTIPLLRSLHDHLELGAPPVLTSDGWLVLYSYIRNYFTQARTFGIEAFLLDTKDVDRVIARTQFSLLVPIKPYELRGNVANVVFPSGASLDHDTLTIYYGASDTTTCLATSSASELISDMKKAPPPPPHPMHNKQTFVRFEENPIISPIPELDWESRATFNPAAIFLNGKVHLLYRAMSQNNVSVLGYAASSDGLHINERSDKPAYLPKEPFETKSHYGTAAGCEDPRITKIKDMLYMCYTAYDGLNPPRVAITAISVSDFLKKQWDWRKPVVISPLGLDDKDSCLMEEPIMGKYIIFHRLGLSIWIDTLDSLEKPDSKWLGGKTLINPRPNMWDNIKIGISAPPVKIEKGWLLLYHSICSPGNVYKVGALLLQNNNPWQVLARSDKPLFDPQMPYEKEGRVANVVFPCGAVLMQNTLYIYYGGGDFVVGVATMKLTDILQTLSPV